MQVLQKSQTGQKCFKESQIVFSLPQFAESLVLMLVGEATGEVAGGDGRLHLPACHPCLGRGDCGRPGFESEVQRE